MRCTKPLGPDGIFRSIQPLRYQSSLIASHCCQRYCYVFVCDPPAPHYLGRTVVFTLSASPPTSKTDAFYPCALILHNPPNFRSYVDASQAQSSWLFFFIAKVLESRPLPSFNKPTSTPFDLCPLDKQSTISPEWISRGRHWSLQVRRCCTDGRMRHSAC